MKNLKLILKPILFCFIFLLFLFGFSPVLAHPGRTDAYGCHTCRTNCAKWGLRNGEYHCHNAKSLPQPMEPVKSKFSETGGVTVPAPEYKEKIIVNEVVNLNKPKEASKYIELNQIDLNKSLKPVVKSDSWFKKLLKFIFR